MSYIYAYRHDLRSAAERSLDTGNCERATSRPVRPRRLVAGNKTYAAYSAHELLQSESDTNLARPGHVY